MKNVQLIAILICCCFGVMPLAAQNAYADLVKQAGEKQKAGAYAESIVLWRKIIDSPDANGQQKLAAATTLSWTLAWPLNRMRDAAETMVKAIDFPGLNDSQKAGAAGGASGYLMRLKPPERERAIALMKPYMGPDSKLPPRDFNYIARTYASLIYADDPKAAETVIERAIAMPGLEIRLRNELRRHFSQLKRDRKTYDAEGACVWLEKISADSESTPSDRIGVLLESAKIWTEAPNPDFVRANQYLAKVAASPDASVAQKGSAALALAENQMRGKSPNAQAAYAAFGAIMDNAALPANVRVQAFARQLNIAERNLQLSEADRLKLCETAARIPGLGEGDARKIIECRKNLLIALKRYDEARKICESYTTYRNDAEGRRRIDEWIGSVLAAAGDQNGAIEHYRKGGDYRAAANLMFAMGKAAEADALLIAGLNEGKDAGRMFESLTKNHSFAELAKLISGPLKDYLAKHPAAARHFSGKLNDAMMSGAYEFVAAVAPLTLAADPKQVSGQTLTYLINANAMLGRLDEARKLISAAAADPKVQEEKFRFRFRILDAALNANDRKNVCLAVRKVVDEFKTKITDVKLMTECLDKAGQTLVMFNDRMRAEGLFDCRRSLFTEIVNQKTDAHFVPNLPRDVTGWMASDIVKKRRNAIKLERALWEANIEFLLQTDVAVKRDVQGGKNAKNGVDTDLYFYCDEHAFYVFIHAFDDNAAKFASGFASGGSYEIYLAPGDFQPYFCSLIDITTGRADTFYSAYRNPYTRAPKTGNCDFAGIQTETRTVAPNATATLLTYPWEYFYNVLPEAGKPDAWQFDLMRWTGNGFSWSGTQSVHNRSTYGDVVFQLTPDQLTAIRKNILFAARKSYRGFVGNPWRGTGIFNFWSDEALGDPVFYETKLVPLKRELDAAAEQIKPEMDDASVNTVFLKYADLLFNLDFVVARLRTTYLSDRWFGQED